MASLVFHAGMYAICIKYNTDCNGRLELEKMSLVKDNSFKDHMYLKNEMKNIKMNFKMEKNIR